MKLWPTTLFGRNVLLIAVLLVGGQLLSAVIVRELVLKPRFDRLGEGLAGNVGGLRAGLARMPLAQRAAFVEAFNRRAGFAAAADADADAGPAAVEAATSRARLTPLQRRFVRVVTQRLGADGVPPVWRREAGSGLGVRLMLDGAPYWVALPGALPASEFTGAWLVASLASVLLALLGALLVQRRLHRPLAAVVQAARTLGRGATPQPLPEDGPSEVATLGRSFNQMVASLARTERERAVMLAGISHDLRTPLTKLRLGVEILSAQMEPALVAAMTRHVEEMDAVVGQFLDFARGDEGEPLQPGDIAELARSIAAACADQGQGLTLELGATPVVPIRPQALRRALINLVENAFRHGAPPVRLRTAVQGEGLVVEVIDHGAGIAAQEAEALKQPFRRAGTARHGAPGSGLGLAIVERIARSHGGALDLLPGAHGGLCARLRLPLAGAPEAVGASAAFPGKVGQD